MQILLADHNITLVFIADDRCTQILQNVFHSTVLPDNFLLLFIITPDIIIKTDVDFATDQCRVGGLVRFGDLRH